MENEKVFMKTEEEWESDGVLSSPSAETEHSNRKLGLEERMNLGYLCLEICV